MTLKKDLTGVRDPTMCISWGRMSEGQRTARSRVLRRGCSGAAVEFQEQQEATVAGTVWEHDVESSESFQYFGFILNSQMEQDHMGFFPGQIPVPPPHVLCSLLSVEKL